MNTIRAWIIGVGISLFCGTVSAQSRPFRIDSSTETTIDQALLECVYQYTTVQKTDPAIAQSTATNVEQRDYFTILQANASTSKFWDYHLFKRDSIIGYSSQPLRNDSLFLLRRIYVIAVDNQFVSSVYKNYPKARMTVTDEIAPYNYVYEEPCHKLEWELFNDTLSVCGYVCRRAVTKYGGREWVAWYSPEIAIGDGPWKLYGLPGLILKATDRIGTHTFTAIQIRQTDRPIYISKNSSAFKVKREVFLKNKAKLESEIKPMSTLSIDSTTPIERIGENYFINGKRVQERRTTVYDPLEFE